MAMSVNYLGEVDSASAMQLLQRVEGALGPIADERLCRFHEVDLVAEIVEEQLSLTLSFSTARYAQAKMQSYLNSVLNELQALAAMDQVAWGEVEPAGMGFDVDLSDSDLDALLNGVASDES